MIRRKLPSERRNMAGGPQGWGWNDPGAIPPPNMRSMSRAGVTVTEQTAMQVDVVFTALRVLSNAIIKMKNPRAYTFSTDDQGRRYKVFLPNQPAILTNTFGGLFQYDGQRRTVISMALHGEAFWYVLTRDAMQRPSALEVLHPSFLKIKEDKATGIKTYEYGSGPDKVVLDPKNLIHIPFMAMPGAARGLSSIEFAGVNYALAIAAMEYGSRWFAQGASPSFLLSTEQKLGPDEVKRIAETFLVEHSGLQSAHLPLVLDSGLQANKISSTPDEAQFLGTLEYARTCLAAWFGLPAHLVGGMADKGNVWGKTVQEQGFQMLDFTLSGYTVPLEEAYASLLPRGQFVDHDESAILRANSSELAALITALRSTGVESKNDIRVGVLDMPPVPGGDDLDAPLNSNVAPPAPGAGQQDGNPDNPDNGGDGTNDAG